MKAGTCRNPRPIHTLRSVAYPSAVWQVQDAHVLRSFAVLKPTARYPKQPALVMYRQEFAWFVQSPTVGHRPRLADAIFYKPL